MYDVASLTEGETASVYVCFVPELDWFNPQPTAVDTANEYYMYTGLQQLSHSITSNRVKIFWNIAINFKKLNICLEMKGRVSFDLQPYIALIKMQIF